MSGDKTVGELNAELDRLSAEFLTAAERYVRERSVEAFGEWQAAMRRYMSVHRRWWALVSPEVDYEAAFGGELAGPPPPEGD
jgi:hypothetical protein